MKTKLISLLIISAALVCNAAFAESGYIQHVRKNAEAGQAWAENALGDAFYFGIDMEANPKKAFEWYRKAAEQGDSAAMNAVGILYYFGEGAEKNYKKAEEWYRKAAESCDKMVKVCMKAVESCESEVESCEADDEACGAEIEAVGVCNANSLYSLARMYEHGIGVERNLSEAAGLYDKAIKEYSDMNSLYALAKMHLNNDRLKTSDRNTLFWGAIMAANYMAAEEYLGYKDAANAVDDLHLNVSPAKYKKILTVADKVYDEFQTNLENLTEEAIANLSVRIAVTEDASETLSAEDVYNRVWRSVVYIQAGIYSGSGVIVQPDIVATNCHVLDDAGTILVHQPKERSGTENEPFLTYDSVRLDGRDYCLLYVPDLIGSGVPATIRPYNTLRIGETVYALGAPKGEKLSLSKGIISQLRNDSSEGWVIQSDVDSAGGSSGGGLFDSAGNLIGHPTYGLRDEQGMDLEGLGFSVPADIVLEFE